MNSLPLFVFGIVLCIFLISILPQFVIYLIGCYQIGSWIGEFINKKLND